MQHEWSAVFAVMMPIGPRGPVLITCCALPALLLQPDGVPPELVASIDNVQGTSFDLSLELDETGEARCLVVLEGAGAEGGSSPPSAADVLNVPPQELFPEGLEAVVNAQFTTDSLAVIERVRIV